MKPCIFQLYQFVRSQLLTLPAHLSSSARTCVSSLWGYLERSQDLRPWQCSCLGPELGGVSCQPKPSASSVRQAGALGDAGVSPHTISGHPWELSLVLAKTSKAVPAWSLSWGAWNEDKGVLAPCYAAAAWPN